MFAQYGLANTHLGVIIAHSVLAVPFVVVNETASLQGINHRLEHAAASMAACHYRFTQPTRANRSSSSSYEAPSLRKRYLRFSSSRIQYPRPFQTDEANLRQAI